MTNLIEKYRPTTQKGLFHNNNVNAIKKWIQNIEYSTNYQLILYIHGPIGCGKTTTLDILLKSFNVIELNSDDLRTNDGINESISQCIDFKSITLENISKWNHSNRKDKLNIVVIECLEQTDKTIHSFLEILYKEKKINVPVIIVANSKKINEVFSKTPNFTSISFNKPSLLEVSKLLDTINKEEKLGLDKQMKNTLIEFVESDLRQLFQILTQYKLRKESSKNVDFNLFLNSFDKKLKDIDLYDTMNYFYNPEIPVDIEYMFLKSSSEPLLLNNSMFYNYLNIIDTFESHYNMKIGDELFDAVESCSDANIYNNYIYKQHFWDLMPYYVHEGVITPSVIIKKSFENKTIQDNRDVSQIIDECVIPFRDISHNYFNSFNDIQKNTRFDITKYHNDMSISLYIQLIIKKLDEVEKLKKTQKGHIEESDELQSLVKMIYEYDLYNFEDDNSEVKTIDEYVTKNISRINIRPLKKMMNIFVIKKLPTYKNSEVLICKGLLKLIFEKRIPKNTITSSNKLEDMLCNLDSIWNFV